MIEEIIYDLNLKNISNSKKEKNIDKFIKPIFYDTEEFHEYHKKFIEKVYKIYMVKEGKKLGYLYAGIKNKVMKAPYSAPFSLVYPKSKYTIDQINHMIRGIIECGEILNCKEIIIRLPAEIYENELINAEWAAMCSNGFVVDAIQINHYFNLLKFKNKELFLKELSCSSRQNYNIALKNNLIFSKISNENFHLAYEVIKNNREEMGYPLKILESQMKDLINMDSLTCRCFGVKKEDDFIAAAIIFDVTDKISQLIYWGDNPQYRKLRPMAFLAANIFEYYTNLDKNYLDIGPSSEDRTINIGLADFKKSIGCDNNIKITFKYEF